ncbi:MAG: efflux RND transporter periplasmic adaptor subunit [Oleiphilaceae bacterium]|nr:efflux RND transporter periplasmic adaptor subunit [Oleiphilaceae bacterium]
MKKQFTLAVLILGMAALLLWWFFPAQEESGGGAGGPQQRARNVNVAAPEILTLSNTLQAVGTTAARDGVDLASEVDGRVAELRFDEGDRVETGQVLVVLDESQARADLAVAEARLEDARTQFARAERLRPSNNISEAEFDERRSALNLARAEYQASLTRLENRRIKAPFSGTLGLREISPGSYINAGQRLTTLDTLSVMDLEFSVPERFIAELAIGQSLSARSGSFPDREFTGEVLELGTRIDPLSRTLRVRARLDNSESLLRPGQFMTVSLTLGQRQALVIPEQAVLTQGVEQYAYVVVDDNAERRTLQLGQRRPGRVEVLEGIGPDDSVVITGQDRLSSGDKVRVLEDPEALMSETGQQRATQP